MRRAWVLSVLSCPILTCQVMGQADAKYLAVLSILPVVSSEQVPPQDIFRLLEERIVSLSSSCGGGHIRYVLRVKI